MHRRVDLRACVLLLLVAFVAAACVTRPETPRERIASAQLALKTIYGTAADVKARDLALEMGVSDSRVSRIENSRTVTQFTADRYLRGLETLATVSPPDSAKGAA